LHQVGGYPGYTGHDVNVLGDVALTQSNHHLARAIGFAARLIAFLIFNQPRLMKA
jgi:hypothetical protein